jgi:methyl-accepting chemotaxis protein
MPKKSRDIEGVQHRLEAGRPPTSPESHAGTSARARLMMNRKPKSLMKRSDLSTKGAVGAGGQPSAAAGSARPRTAGSAATRLERSTTGTTRPATKLATSRPVASKTPKTPPMPVPAGRQQQIEERLAAATEELASGITEAASAAEELRRTMEQIATGAEEAASAAQQTLAVANTTASTLLQARQRAESAQGRSDRLRSLLAETASQVRTWASNIRSNGERQTNSVAVMDQLSAQAASIGDVTRTVSHVSDETNLLALNAAIEAARAGDHGRGFAVVADEVRALAETSERSARDVQNLAEQIQQQVKSVAAMIKNAAVSATAEAEKSQTVILALGELRKEVGDLAETSRSIALGAVEAETASREAQRGAEIISSAAEEQAAAAAEALRSVEQQSAALEESQSTTQSLASLAGDIGASAKDDGRVDQMAAAAEQLSATVQEISGAAAQIMVAVEQISRGGQQQAAATQEASAAISQIDRMAQAAKESAALSFERAKRGGAMLAEIRLTINNLAAGITHSLETTRTSIQLIADLEEISRRVDKIVDGIAMVSIQTNMLAVSGSVEAARAGDFGKGFAVVSKNIRNLARDCGENAGRVKDIVRAIRDQIGMVRRELEQVISAAETENQKTTGVLSSIGVVERDVDEIATGSQQILSGADSILLSMKEAVRGAQQVAAAAEEAGSAATQAATAAEQQASTAESLAAAIEEIASLAEAIQRRNG